VLQSTVKSRGFQEKHIFILEIDMTDEMFGVMAQAIIDGDPDRAAQLAQQAVDQGIDPLEAINAGFIKGVDHVGDAFSRAEAFIPQLVMAGEAMKAAIAVLEPELERQGQKREVLGKVVMATVEGDIHDIGKTLVATMLSASGFEVYDLGADVPVAVVANKAREFEADIVGLSALLTTTMLKQKAVIEALEDLGIRDKVYVMVGGSPVTRKWQENIGADGFSEDATGAVIAAKELLGKS
jgi:corrinoid protein of di/trimethylamine methyltransferase